jgi:pimeloyl-ACP methyl ester carboxylesterase
MRTHDLRINVAQSTGLDGAEIACSLYLPDDPPTDTPRELLVCVHGGGYTRAYWHPDFRNFPDYSFAENFCARGHAVLAIDLLGIGESAKPEPETRLSRAIVAAANHHVTTEISAGLQDGRWGNAPGIAITGIGHSIGGMMVITQQAAHRSFDRLAVLGWTNQPLVLAGLDPALLAASIAPGYLATPREKMRPLFYASDVPQALIEADEAAGSTTPACLGRDALQPGIVREASAAITVPVFVMHGSTDTSPNPHGEVVFFTSSNDIAFMRLPESAHCHNFATSRHRLWNRLESWIAAFPVPVSKERP